MQKLAVQNVSWNFLFGKATSDAAIEWLQISIDTFIPSLRFWVKSDFPSWFNAIVHWNLFYQRFEQNHSDDFQLTFPSARNACKRTVSDAKSYAVFP